MENTLYKIAILAFTCALVIHFNEPSFLFFLFMLLFVGKKGVKKSVTEEFDAVHERLDMLIKHSPPEPPATKIEPK